MQGGNTPVSFSRRIGSLFVEGRAMTTTLFWTVTFLSLLILYGANTWLPTLMTAAGFALKSALVFLLVLNLGAVVGGLAAAQLADRFGSRVVIASSFFAAALCFVLLAARPPMPLVYPLVAVAGFGATGTQLLVNAYVGSSYPTRLRATALGMSLGIGRLGGILGPTYGGYVLAANLPQEMNFFAFAVPAIAAALVVIGVRPSSEARPTPSSEARPTTSASGTTASAAGR